MIKAEKLSYSFPQKELYNKVSFTIEDNVHCAFIGTNGTGKSTLADMILHPDDHLYEGKLTIDVPGRIGYVSQFYSLDEEKEETVFTYLSETFVQLQNQINEICDAMATAEDLEPLMEKYQTVMDEFQAIDGDFYESNIHKQLKVAGLKEVPVVIREYSKQQAMEIALIENVQRADLNPIEEAIAYQQLMDEFDLTQEEIAERVSKSRVTVTNSIRLLKLDRRVQEMLIQGQVTSGHARALLGLEDGEQQYQVALKIVGEHLSVREVEKLVKALTKPKKPEKEKEEERDLSFIFHDLEERMKQVMGTKVVINKRDKNKGKVEIEYYSEAELERIVELIESIRQ